MQAVDYHDVLMPSYSLVSKFAECPETFRRALLRAMDATRPKDAPTQQMLLGTYIQDHIYGLEPNVVEQPARNSNYGKARYAELEAAGAKMLPKAQYEAYQAVTADYTNVAHWVEAIRSPDAVREQPMIVNVAVWGDDWQLKAKPDVYLPTSGYLIDIKCSGLSAHAFRREVKELYAMQLALYRDGLAQQGIEVSGCYILRIDINDPYVHRIYQLSEGTLSGAYYRLQASLADIRHKLLSIGLQSPWDTIDII